MKKNSYIRVAVNLFFFILALIYTICRKEIKPMWKLVFWKIFFTCLIAYIIITRQYFWDIAYYLGRENFWSMYCVTVPMLWLYMLVASILFNIFMVYLPWSINRLPHWQRCLLFFVLSLVLVVLLHLGQMDLLFRMKQHTVFSSGYVYRDLFFFLLPLLAYHIFLYRRPDLSIFNIMIWNLFKRGIRIGMDSFSDGHAIVQDGGDGHASITLPMTDEEAVGGQEVHGMLENRIKVYNILLMFFSKKQPSYFIDKTGNKIFINHTSTVIKGWKVCPWFVKVSGNVYLNMWYFTRSPYSDAMVLMEESVWRHIAGPMEDRGEELSGLLKVSERCKKNLTQHFEYRDRLDETGWEEYFYY